MCAKVMSKIPISLSCTKCSDIFLHLVTGDACDKNGSSTLMHRQSVSALFLELSFDAWKMLAEDKSTFSGITPLPRHWKTPSEGRLRVSSP